MTHRSKLAQGHAYSWFKWQSWDTNQVNLVLKSPCHLKFCNHSAFSEYWSSVLEAEEIRQASCSKACNAAGDKERIRKHWGRAKRSQFSAPSVVRHQYWEVCVSVACFHVCSSADSGRLWAGACVLTKALPWPRTMSYTEQIHKMCLWN